MTDLDGVGERVEVTVHGQDVVFRLPCGEDVIATRTKVSKSTVLRQTLHTAKNGGKAVVGLPKGCLLAWLQCAKAMEPATAEGSDVNVAELCQALPTPRLVECLQVVFRTSSSFADTYIR